MAELLDAIRANYSLASVKNALPPAVQHLAVPLHPERWDWSAFLDPAGFKWALGLTPLTNLEFVALTWVVYFTTIIVLRLFMAGREPFKLRTITAIHNLILTLWSLGMFVFIVYDIYLLYAERGVKSVFCFSENEAKRASGRLWFNMYIYYVSKFYELLDTVILVLKKRPLIFLHWYHHAIVILMVWTWMEWSQPFASLGMAANTLVHVFMYYYYYKASLGQNVWFKKYITSGQIVQFTCSFILLAPFLYYHFTVHGGCAGFNASMFSVACNGSFLLLFAQFYMNTYKTPSAGAREKKITKKE